MKTNDDKRVNQMMRLLNRQLHRDVFESRFSAHMLKKMGYRNCHEIHYYQFELRDSDQPERNEMVFLNQFEVLFSMKLHNAMNDFIVHSNFWNETWPKKKESYLKEKDMCFECGEYTPYTIRKERITVYSLPDCTPYSILGERAYCKKCKKPVEIPEVKIRNLVCVQALNPEVTRISYTNFASHFL